MNIETEIKDFVSSMKGKTRATPEEVNKMFELYNKKFRQNETNYNCELCVMRVFNRLKKVK